MRDSPAIDIINLLQNDGAKITAFDPKAMESAGKVLENVDYAKDLYSAADKADLLIILTEWNEFKEIDFDDLKKRMKNPNIVDGRNLYNPEDVRGLGFTYIGIGR